MKKSGEALTLDGVCRAFLGKSVLKGVSARARRGRVIGLLGRNGEGKSTLISMILDILAADAGRIEVLGRPLDGSGEIRRLVGYVPERPVFHDFMTVAQVFELRRRFFPAWNPRKAASAADRLGLDLQTRIAGASKGTLGKVAWVCATAHEPDLLLLDEPTSGLDALVREDVLNGLVGELQSPDRTILVANHHMEEFAGLLDEVWVLADGVISGVHEMEALRREACRLRGRLKKGRAVPPGLRVVPLTQEGSLVEWGALDAAAADQAAQAGVLENLERVSLTPSELFALLLRQAVGGSHV
jgi:ABC-2 type transport system ATP-binding protein